MTSIRYSLSIIMLFALLASCSKPPELAPNVAAPPPPEYGKKVDTSEDSPNGGGHPASGDRAILGKVVSVSDGDTIAIHDGATQHKIRLAGIDAPESGQAFGQRSKQNLSRLIFGKKVTAVGNKTDRYGRFVGKIFIDHTDINLEQLKAGLAWHYKKYANEQSPDDQEKYAVTEVRARSERLGLWLDSNPTPPWEKRLNDVNDNVKNIPIGAIIGNRLSRIYHLRGCSTYGKVSPRNQVIFSSAEEAESSGFRIAQNCSP